MPEPCTLYLSSQAAPTLEQLTALAPGAKVSRLTPRPGDTRESLEVRWPDLRITINRMDQTSPGLAAHLEGFRGYVGKLAGGKISPRVRALREQIGRTQHVLGMMVDPGFDDDPEERAWMLVHQLATEHLGLVFWFGTVMDSELRCYLANGGEHDPEARLPLPSSAQARKQRSEARLQSLGIPFLPSLPIVRGDDEILLYAPGEVARRAVALTTVAVRGEGLEQDKAVEILRGAGMWDSASPQEQAFLQDPDPDEQRMITFCWRYEALWVLLWALGLVELGLPTAICDPAVAVGLVLDTGPQELVAQAKLRPLPEILDELDFTYRCHWACVNARLHGQEAPAGLDPGVVYERHYALNWLTCGDEYTWDNVPTHT